MRSVMHPLTGLPLVRIPCMPCDINRARVPVVAITGHAGNPDQRQACFDAGIQEILDKSAELFEIQSALNTYVLNIESNTLAAPKGVNTPKKTQVDRPVIDWVASIKLYQGNKSFVREMLSILAQDLKDRLPVLEKAIASENIKILRFELHRLRGGLCYLKLPELESCFNLFYKAVESDSEDKVQLTLAYAAVQRAIQNFLKAWKTERA